MIIIVIIILLIPWYHRVWSCQCGWIKLKDGGHIIPMRNGYKMIHCTIPFELLSGCVFGGVIISLWRSTLKSDKLPLVCVLVITISR